MIDFEKLNLILSCYKNSFRKHWDENDEGYKWRAVKCFQDNWNIDADDFADMFDRATEKGENLLTSARNFPRGMITEFAKADTEATRSMFQTLFDESQDLAFRIESFRKSSGEIQSKYGNGRWKNHYQNTNAISTYLWLKYPDKYYIYKYGVNKSAAEQLGSDYKPKADGSVSSMIGGYRMYDEICTELRKDEELRKMLQDVLTPECYPDPELRTLTVDFGHYIDAYYPNEMDTNVNGNNSGRKNNFVPDKKYWLISWNPSKWNWEEYDQLCIDTTSNHAFICRWSCMNTNPKIGDEVFLIKLGHDKPRGIIGHATVHRESYSDGHYDPNEADKGKQSNYIDLEFDRLLNYKTEKIILQDELKEKCPSQTWSPMSSGIEIKADAVPMLQNLWKSVTGEHNSKDLSGEEPMPIDDTLFSRNMILYGPPGTGKTYNAVNYAVAICESRKVEDVRNEKYQDVLARYNELKEKGRIAFTTFHQSYGYEEFIEGIRPIVNEDEDRGRLEYEISDGIFKKFCNAAGTPESPEIDHNAAIWYVRLNSPEKNDLKTECFRDGEIRFEGEEEPGREFAWVIERLMKMKRGDFVLSYGGKSAIVDGIGIVVDDEPYYDDAKTSYKWTRKVKWLLKNISINVKEINGGYYLPNFEISSISHMNLSDLLRVVEENGGVAYTSNKKPYVFIIDEINRGNISKIFGELITLIEGTKREGADEAMDVILPYSGKRFSVPDNVYILGTMNTADRSIALLDTALRRRFDFIEMMPDNEFLEDVIVEDSGQSVDIRKMFETMNQRIGILYDREHMIGHAYFKKLREEPTLENLREIFLNRIIPLLQEYFYDDYEKIRLVLGDNDKNLDNEIKFITAEEVLCRKFFRGNADSDDFDDKVIYRINKDAFSNPASYKKIYE